MPFDPNGAIYWKGRYHLFYIFQDKRGHNWGHVSSTDLFHWRHHPTGLVSGMFSGNCFVNKEGRPTMCYHQVGQGNAMAVALDDELNEWKKLDSNPITPKTKPGDPHHDKYRSWDPYGWLEGDTYYAIFGGEQPGHRQGPQPGRRVEIRRRPHGQHRAGRVDQRGRLLRRLLQAGDQANAPVHQPPARRRYYLGEWKGEQFHPTFHEKMSWVDNSFFAPESLLDDKGRRIMWAWIFDSPRLQDAHRLWLVRHHEPAARPLAGRGWHAAHEPAGGNRAMLRYNGKKKANLSVKADSDLALDGIGGNSLELGLEMNAKDARQFGIKVCCSPGGEEQTLVYYDAVEKKLKVDTTKSSLADGPKNVEAGPFELKADEPLQAARLRGQIGRRGLCQRRRQAVMRRIYPSRADSVGVRLFSIGGPATVASVDAWELMPSNPY